LIEHPLKTPVTIGLKMLFSQVTKFDKEFDIFRAFWVNMGTEIARIYSQILYYSLSNSIYASVGGFMPKKRLVKIIIFSPSKILYSLLANKVLYISKIILKNRHMYLHLLYNEFFLYFAKL